MEIVHGDCRLEAGFARADITPPIGATLLGYPGGRTATGVGDQLSGTVLALRSGDLVCLIVALDWCLIGERDVESMREAIRAAAGCRCEAIQISASHTHSGPMTIRAWGLGEYAEDYVVQTRAKIAEASARAIGSLAAASVGIGVGRTTVGVNRREVLPDGRVILGVNEWGAVDRDVTVIRFEGAGGSIGSVIHLGVHPTSRGIEPLISRDWPGVMVDRVEQLTGAPAVFVNGSAGDVAPRTAGDGPNGYGEAAAQEIGLSAARDALRAWRSASPMQSAALDVATGDIRLPLAPLPAIEEAREQYNRFAVGGERQTFPGAEVAYWAAVIEAHGRPQATHKPFAQEVIRIGEAAIVPMSGEVFADTGLRLKKASPFAHTLVASTTNGADGYYCPCEAHARGGYEPWAMRAMGVRLMSDHVDDVLVSENSELLKALHGGGEETP